MRVEILFFIIPYLCNLYIWIWKKIISKLELSGLSNFEAESTIKEVENYILSNNKIGRTNVLPIFFE